jgi:hypothetical protein
MITPAAIDACGGSISSVKTETDDAIVVQGERCSLKRLPMPSSDSLERLIAGVADRLGTNPDEFNLEKPLLAGAGSVKRLWLWPW